MVMRLDGLKISALIIAVIFSSITLFLVESEFKYVLFVLEFALFLILFFSLVGEVANINLHITNRSRFKFDYFFIIISSVLLVMTVFNVQNLLRLVCALSVCFFLPGYVFLRLLNFQHSNSWVEWLAVSFGLSLGITSVIFTIMLPFSGYRALLLSLAFTILSFFPMLKDWFTHKKDLVKDYTINFNLSDFLILFWVVLFIVLSLSFLYPQMSIYPGLDISRHFSASRLLVMAPDVYHSPYPWFHACLATVHQMSSSVMEVFQTSLSYLSVIFVFSFYIMSKAHLRGIDKRAPVIATLFFSVFSGFGWVFFLIERLNIVDAGSSFAALCAANDASYFDVGYGQGAWNWLWFRPMTVSFSIFFILLYFLSRKSFPRLSFMLIFSFLIITLGFIHVPELLFFNLLLVVLSLFTSKLPALRLRDASLATLVGSIIYSTYATVSGILSGIVTAPSLQIISILLIASLISFFLTHRYSAFFWSAFLSKYHRKGVEILAGVLSLLFMTGLLAWLSSPTSFSTAQVYEAYYIPLMMYPVLLGVTGFFALHGLAVLAKENKCRLLAVIILLFIVVLAFGKCVSFVNVNFFDMGYGERRFLPLLFAAVCILAAVSIIKLSSSMFNKRRKVLFCGMLALIVMGGITSTYLSVDYWKLATDKNHLSSYALDATQYLSSSDSRDIQRPILAASTSTRLLSEYLPSPYIIDRYRYPIWESKYPELPLLLLYTKYYSSPYLYMDENDETYISNNYAGNFFAEQLIPLSEKIYENPQITLDKIPDGVPPSLNSETVLVIPNNNDASCLPIYCMLSFAGADYTVSLPSDLKTIAAGKTILMPQDNGGFLQLLDTLESNIQFQQDNKTVMVFNVNGGGPISDLFFDPPTQSSYEGANTIKGPDFTLNLTKEVNVESIMNRENVNVLSWYSDGENEVPFAAVLTKNWGALIYINVYPIMSAIQDETIKMDPRQILNLSMNERNGQVQDMSGTGNDGVCYATEKVNSPFGGALSFDGEESFIEIPNSGVLNAPTQLSIEAWVKPRTPENGFAILSKKADYSSLTGYTLLFDGGTFYFNFGNGTNYFTNAFPFGSLGADAYYHIIVTYDGQYVRSYINGDLVDSIKQNATIAPNDLNFLVGKRNDNNWKLNGDFFKIAIYNEALNSSEIDALYTDAMSKLWTANPFAPIYGSLIRAAAVTLPSHIDYEEWVFEGNTAFFRSAFLRGDVFINSSSLVNPLITNSANVTILTEQGQQTSFQISNINFDDFEFAEVHVENVTLSEGKGFYIKLTLLNPVIHFYGENSSILLVSGNNESSQILISNGTILFDGQLTLFARMPTFQVDGRAEFKEMNSLFSLQNTLRSLGHDLNIQGKIQFELPVSDSYLFASNFVWSGSFERVPPVLLWNEFNSVVGMLPYLIISGILVVFCYSFFASRKNCDYNP
jgi:hypothetical protein